MVVLMFRWIVFAFLVLGPIYGEIPADVSFLVVDAKYNTRDGVKICEMQEGITSRFRCIKDLYGDEMVYARRFHETLLDIHPELMINLGKVVDVRIHKWMMNYSTEKKALQSRWRSVVTDPSVISSYCGLYIAPTRHVKSRNLLKRKYPGILLMDEAFYPYFGNKYKMTSLFVDDPLLEGLQPQWGVYPKKDSKKIVQRILTDISSDRLVIKPFSTSRGRGVILLDRKDLAATLNYICNSKSKALRKDPDKSYNYWAGDRSKRILVEEFISSDPISVPHLDNQIYDPIYRILVLMTYQQGEIGMKFLGSYAQIPLKPLSSGGSLIDTHKNHAVNPHYCMLDPQVRNAIENQLREALPILYKRLVK